MPTRLPALIFDFGNVVAFFDYSRACAGFARRLGLSPGDLLERLRDRGLNELVRRYERGSITCEEFSRSTSALVELDVSHDEFDAAWSDIFWLNEPVAALVADLKTKGYTLVLGSNTNALHARRFRRQFAAALAPFDRLVLSHEVGQLKPSPAFYHACADAAGAAPGDCLFIDDLPENVEGALHAGLQAVRFRDHPTLIDTLRRSGIEV